MNNWYFTHTQYVRCGRPKYGTYMCVGDSGIEFSAHQDLFHGVDFEKMYHEMAHWVWSPIGRRLLDDGHGLPTLKINKYKATFAEANVFAIADNMLRADRLPISTSNVEGTAYDWREQDWFDGTDFIARVHALRPQWPIARIRQRWVDRCRAVHNVLETRLRLHKPVDLTHSAIG